MIFVGIDIANCSATREDKRRAGQEKTRGGQDPVTEPGHRVKGRSQSVCPGLVSADRGQEKDNSRTRGGQDLATEPSHRVQPGHKAGPQSPTTEFRGAAKTRRRGGQGPDTEPDRVQGRGQ